jgi:hypothetical protein
MENAKRRTLQFTFASNQRRCRRFDMPNWTVNDIFSQTRKLTIVTAPIGGLGHKRALALAAEGALQ